MGVLDPNDKILTTATARNKKVAEQGFDVEPALLQHTKEVIQKFARDNAGRAQDDDYDKDLAEKMHDEFVLQDKMLTDLDSKADKTQTKIDGVNDRMKDALTKLNDKSTNMCIYLICCVLLLGLGVVFYNIAKKNGKI
jgi:uncharacterized coiled-coil DUF342 family protein